MSRAVNNKFFETRDYSMFKKVRGNRPVDQAHVQQLKKLIADKDLMDPIRVNANIEVVDGQHTLQARKELGLPVPYIIINSDDPLDVARLNQGRKNWSLDHFLGHHCARGKMDYKICKSKMQQWGLPVAETIILLLKISSRYSTIGTTFKEGNFKIPAGGIEHCDRIGGQLNSLKKYGLKINIYDEKKLKKLGMNTLLGVGQGSVRGSYLVTMEWNGLSKKSKPLAFVGKGVCFDTGGISLKPAKFMEDMTYDMAGSAVVVGLMKSLALRKAKINAVGVVGLVENMPGGNAQRPGDIVKSYSGKTVEILNTDAEGRLVLADALTYTEEKFKPKLIVDLATLTGAIIVSLGSEYAGLFSNDDNLSKQLINAGEEVEEKVWRMPLNKNFDKLIDSKNADMQNINYVGGAGSTTAAQFLQRFILNKTPWAHLDIAGMAFSKYGGALNSGGATGYGVRLLNKLIEDNYE